MIHYMLAHEIEGRGWYVHCTCGWATPMTDFEDARSEWISHARKDVDNERRLRDALSRLQ